MLPPADTTILISQAREVGVILKETIDEISAGIEGKIAVYDAQKKEETKPSPFLASQKGLSRVTFGVEVGEFFILEKWADLYNWSLYVKPYMSIRIIDYMGLNLSYDYFSTDNEDIDGATTHLTNVCVCLLSFISTCVLPRRLDDRLQNLRILNSTHE